MTREEFERAKDDINRHPLTDFYPLTPSKGGMYCCPICHSGEGPHHTGALKLYNNGGYWRVYCAKGCFGDKGKSDSTLDALCRLWSMKAVEVMEKLGYIKDAPATRTSGGTGGNRQKPAAPQEQPKPKPYTPPINDYTAKYKEWHTALLQSPEALAYLEGRGIKREAIESLNLGYSPNLGYGEKQSYRAPRIIFPYDAHFYKARRIDGKDEDAKYIPSDGGSHIYNAGAFSDQEADGSDRHLFPVLIVEGELDAAAVYQGGYKRVIALGTTGNKEEFVEQARRENSAAVYILALDNDPEDPNPAKNRAGQTAQAELEKKMDAAGLDYISADTAALYGEYTDAADAVLHDTEGETFWPVFMGLVEQGYYKRKNREDAAQLEAYYRSGPGMVDAFLSEVKGEKYKPLPTGIDTIDRAIGGGLFRQTIVMLGAAPGMGKTALASQICESIAKTGAADVLYINLEMSREQLLARSLARIAYFNGYKEISTTEILQGYRWTIDTEEAVHEAADQYKATIAQHLLYNPGEDTTDLDAVLQKMEDEKKRLGHAPIVCLDYLQLLTGHNGDGRDEDGIATIKRAIQRLKEYAIREDTTVIIITANNRASMATGDSGLNSGRDTSNIEYGADLHLGLVYTAVSTGEKKQSEIEQMQDAYWEDKGNPAAVADYEQYCTGYTLKVNKNRHGAAGRKALLKFNGACALFVPVDTIHTEPQRTATRRI